MGKLLLFLIQVLIVLWLLGVLIDWLANNGRESKTMQNIRRIKKRLADDEDESC